MIREENGVAYWDQKWKLREQRLRERVRLDGSDGEKEFDAEIRRLARSKKVLDIGCGPGEFTLRIAKSAKIIVGIDPSEVALGMAKANLVKSRLRNATFRRSSAEELPFEDESFDLVFSRRGPASENKHNLREVLRVLRRGGTFLEITIGERDKQNLVEVFDRGQMLGFRGQVSKVKKGWLQEVGFRQVVSRDYLGTEVFNSLKDLLIRLRTAPIIPFFDVEKDQNLIEKVKISCTTERGIETPVHRVILMARK